MITRIYADNFRCFSKFEFRPQRVNLLVGDNGSGKSTLLQLLEFLGALTTVSGVLRDHPFRRAFTRWEHRSAQRFELDLALDEGQYRWELVLGRNGIGDLEVQAEKIWMDEVVVAELVPGERKRFLLRNRELPIPFQLDASLLALNLDDQSLTPLLGYTRSWGSLDVDLAHIASTSDRANALLRTDGSNFVAFFRNAWESDPSAIDVFSEKMRDVIGGFQSFDLESVGFDTKKLVARLSSAVGAQYSVDFGELSPGQRALAMLYFTLVWVPLGHQVISFDEPDNFLSLREMQPWLQLLSRRVEEQKLQVFIASHNPEVIDYLAADSVWLFEREEGGPARVRPLPIEPESGLKASEQLRRGWTLGA